MSDQLMFLTSVGRLVQGHPMTPRPVTDDNDVPKTNKDGSPQIQYYIGLAFAKTDPEFGKLYQLMQQVAQRDWSAGEYKSATFAWKYKDGDGVNKYGKEYPAHCKGHWILGITSGFPYPVIDEREIPITDPNRIKRGYYMRAHVGIKGNGPNKSPGLYINCSFAQLCGYGPEIQSGPDVREVLSKAPAIVLPAGASAVPVMGAMSGPAVPGVPAAPSPAIPGVPVGAVPGAAGPAPALPGMPSPVAVPAAPAPMVPAVPMPAPPPVAVAFPPAGWVPHPTATGYFHNNVEALTEAQLRARVGVTPHPAILAVPQ